MRILDHFAEKPHILLLLAQFFWAGNAIAGRYAAGMVPPLSLAFWRWVIAGLIMLPFIMPRVIAAWPNIRRQWLYLVFLSGVSVATYNCFLYTALTTNSAANVTLVSSTVPMVIALLSWGWLGQKLSWRQAAGIGLSLAGVLLVLARGNVDQLLGIRLHEGDLWVLGAVLCWAVYSVTLKRWPTGLDGFTLLFVQIVLGSLCILPFYLMEYSRAGGFDLTAETVGIILFVAIFPSIFAYGFWNIGVARVGAQIAGLYTNFIPAFTAVLAALLLGEAIEWHHGVGLFLIAMGVWRVSRG